MRPLLPAKRPEMALEVPENGVEKALGSRDKRAGYGGDPLRVTGLVVRDAMLGKLRVADNLDLRNPLRSVKGVFLSTARPSGRSGTRFFSRSASTPPAHALRQTSNSAA